MQFFEDLHDVTLVTRARIGDLAALEVLITRYRRVLYSVAIGIVGEPAQAREVTHTALLRAYAYLSMDDPDCGFFSLSHRLLVQACFDRVPRHGGAERAEVVTIGKMTFDDRRRRVQQALLRLDLPSRAVVALRHLAGLSYTESATTLEQPLEIVRRQLHEARQQLGEWLLAWPADSALGAAEECLLQSGLDGALDYWEREARERLLQEHPPAAARAAALRDLGQLLNSLGPTEPPPDLVPAVLAQVAGRISSF
jgi:RNA polymerase sigma-70 factor (ECF subfamily)